MSTLAKVKKSLNTIKNRQEKLARPDGFVYKQSAEFRRRGPVVSLTDLKEAYREASETERSSLISLIKSTVSDSLYNAFVSHIG